MLNLPEHVCLFLVDALSFVFVAGFFLVTKGSTSLPVYSKEFVKDDANYLVPLQDPTLTPGLMSILSHVSPLMFIVVLCVVRVLQREGFNTGLQTVVPPQKLGQLNIPPAVMAGLFYTGYFLYGACMMAILDTAIAHMVGQLSPNFLAVCKPNYTEGALVFTREICTGEQYGVHKASLSFPSQYAAHLSYGFFFNTSIVYCIPHLRKVPMTRLLLMFVVFLLPIIGSLTRYTEGYNSLVHVLVGIALGFISAAFVVFIPLRLFGLCASANEDARHPTHSQQAPNVTFDQLSNLPYTDLQVEMDEQ